MSVHHSCPQLEIRNPVSVHKSSEIRCQFIILKSEIRCQFIILKSEIRCQFIILARSWKSGVSSSFLPEKMN